MSGLTSLRNSLWSACSAVQRLLGSRFNMWSKRSRADGGMLEEGERGHNRSARRGHTHTLRTCFHAENAQTHKANSSLRRLRYCFFGFMVWKKGSLMTSGQTAGQGLPQIRLGGWGAQTKHRWCEQSRRARRDLCRRGLCSTHLMSSSCASSWLAWNMGLLVNSSPRMHLWRRKDERKVIRLSPNGTDPSLVTGPTRSSTRQWRACTSPRPGAALVGGTIA